MSDPCIQDLVAEEMRVLKEDRRAKWGTVLYPNSGVDGLREAYEQAMDLAIYLRQVLYERDNR